MQQVRDESGFTLVELLIAVTVLGIIIVALGAGFSVGLRSLDDTSNRLSGSTDAQQLGVYLLPDVQSASTVVASSTGAGIACTGASNPVLQLTDGASFNVVYGVRTVTSGSLADATHPAYFLERYVCTGGSVQSASTKVVSRTLASATAAAPVRIPATGTLTGAALTVTEKTTTNDTTPYVFTVSGRRRTT